MQSLIDKRVDPNTLASGGVRAIDCIQNANGWVEDQLIYLLDRNRSRKEKRWKQRQNKKRGKVEQKVELGEGSHTENLHDDVDLLQEDETSRIRSPERFLEYHDGKTIVILDKTT